MTTQDRQRWHELLDAAIDGRLHLSEGPKTSIINPLNPISFYSIAPKTIEAWAVIKDGIVMATFIYEANAKDCASRQGDTVVKLIGEVR